jgi:hypothetical protein
VPGATVRVMLFKDAMRNEENFSNLATLVAATLAAEEHVLFHCLCGVHGVPLFAAQLRRAVTKETLVAAWKVVENRRNVEMDRALQPWDGFQRECCMAKEHNDWYTAQVRSPAPLKITGFITSMRTNG